MQRMDLARQYATSANLAARIELHQRFSTNPSGLQRWVFDRLQLAPGMRVLEIACGAGSLWRENLDRMPRGICNSSASRRSALTSSPPCSPACANAA